MTVHDGKAIYYTVAINEEQRALLASALNVIEADLDDEGFALLANLEALPTDEINDPNVVHGLCV